MNHLIEELKNNDDPKAALAVIGENHEFLATHSAFRSHLRWLVRNAGTEHDAIVAILPHLRSQVTEGEALARAALASGNENEKLRVLQALSQNPHFWSEEVLRTATSTPTLHRAFSTHMVSGLSRPRGIEEARTQASAERLTTLLLDRFPDVNRRTLESLISNRNIPPLEASSLLKALRINDPNVITAISEIVGNVNEGTNFETALRNFLSSSHTTNERRAAILRTMSNRADFERFLGMAPEPNRAQVVREMGRRNSFYPSLWNLARTRGVTPEQLSQIDLLAYEYIALNADQLGATKVTQFEWFLVMGSNPSHFNDGPDSIVVNGIRMQPNRPVEQVSWDDIQEFLNRRNDANDPSHDSRYRYDRTPEKQWELEARGGTTTEYSFGNDVTDLGNHGWYAENSGNQTHDVGQLRPNPSGFYDIHGNVWEWMAELYSNSGSARVLRGGGWDDDARYLLSAYRYYYSPGSSYDVVGFRLLRTPLP